MYAGTCRLSVLVVADIWQLVFADYVNWVVRGPDLLVDVLSVVLWQIMMGVPLLLGTSSAEAFNCSG